MKSYGLGTKFDGARNCNVPVELIANLMRLMNSEALRQTFNTEKFQGHPWSLRLQEGESWEPCFVSLFKAHILREWLLTRTHREIASVITHNCYFNSQCFALNFKRQSTSEPMDFETRNSSNVHTSYSKELMSTARL